MIKNRTEAGKLLAQKLKEEISPDLLTETFILAIPRGGVIIGNEVKDILGVKLDCLITKKIPAPEEEDVVIGAVSEGGVVVWEDKICEQLKVPVEYKQEIVKQKVEELQKKKTSFRGEKSLPLIKDKRVILIDDGVATGATIKASIKVLRDFAPKEIIVATPFISLESLEEIKEISDRVVYLESPPVIFSLTEFYEEFGQITDEQIKAMLF
jgi:predicted phosphoribosyltransferase